MKPVLGKLLKNKTDSILITIICTIAYRLSLDYAMIQFFDELYRQSSDLSLEFQFSQYAESLAALVFLSTFAAYIIKKKTVSTIMFYLLFLLSYVPGTCIYGLLGLPMQYFIFFNIYWFILTVALILMPKTSLRMRLNIVGHSYYPFYCVVIAASLFALWFSYVYTGFRLILSLDGLLINLLRDESYEFLTGLYAYLMFWIGNVIVPMAIVHFFMRKKWICLCFVCFVQVVMFSINGTKTWLFLIPACILSVSFYKDSIIKYTSFAFAIINVIGVWAWNYFGDFFLTNFITRRMFIAQAINNYFYYDFFLNHNKDMLAGSILRWFGAKTSYPLPIPVLIGESYYNFPEMFASSGLFADAYSNFGVVGLFIYPIMLAVFFKIYELAAEGIRIKEILSILIVSAVFLLNGSFFTVFLTYGLLAGILIMIIFPRNYTDKNQCLHTVKATAAESGPANQCLSETVFQGFKKDISEHRG